MALLHFEIRGEDYGTGNYEYTGAGDLRGHCYFCPLCGEVWAKATVHGAVYNVWAAKCDRHPDREIYWEWAGSIWRDWERDFEDAMPRRVLERELELHMKAAERRYA